VRAFRQTQLQASTDALTGLPNRRALEEATRDVVAETEPFALLMCDLDHFKRLNDEHGHQAGDVALRIFSEALRGSLRSEDLAARWGGEEFCVLLKGAGAGDAVAWADRLRGHLAESLAKTASPTFTASFGVADSTMSRDIDALVKMADGALYQAKNGGRDRAEIADALAISGEHPRPDSEQRSSVNLWLLSKAV
jgi:diguanylate cyclase (GGDEF)-like protein